MWYWVGVLIISLLIVRGIFWLARELDEIDQMVKEQERDDKSTL